MMKKQYIYYPLSGVVQTSALVIFDTPLIILMNRYPDINFSLICIFTTILLPFIFNLIFFLKDENENSGASFLAVISAIIFTAALWLLSIYDMFGRFSYSQSPDLGSMNIYLENIFMLIHSVINIVLMVFACVVNVFVKSYKRWRHKQKFKFNI